jgi:hypothetical protein
MITKFKMIQIQHIQQNITMASRALNTWSDSLCGDVILGFIAYNNEPKHGGTEV